MKKFILFIITCVVLLTGCQTKSSPKPTKNTDNVEQSKDQVEANKGNGSNVFVSDDSKITDGSEVKVNTSLRTLTNRKVKITVDGHTFIMQLYDNKTADDLYDKLPLTLTANDYGSWLEKIAPLGSSSLSMEGAPLGDCPLVPEVGYYEPGNWIALYYGQIGYWTGKVPLGTIDATAQELESITDGSTIRFIKLNN